MTELSSFLSELEQTRAEQSRAAPAHRAAAPGVFVSGGISHEELVPI